MTTRLIGRLRWVAFYGLVFLAGMLVGVAWIVVRGWWVWR